MTRLSLTERVTSLSIQLLELCSNSSVPLSSTVLLCFSSYLSNWRIIIFSCSLTLLFTRTLSLNFTRSSYTSLLEFSNGISYIRILGSPRTRQITQITHPLITSKDSFRILLSISHDDLKMELPLSLMPNSTGVCKIPYAHRLTLKINGRFSIINQTLSWSHMVSLQP